MGDKMYKEIDKKILLEIFKIPAMSSKEHAMADYIKTVLSNLQVPFKEDSYGNIYNVSNPNKPLLSSHMDTVQSESDSKLAKLINIYELEDGSEILKGLGVIGGDDKCGIYTILEILRKRKDINFVFSKEEEIGCLGIKAFVKEVPLKDKNIPYGLIIDRRYASDIICVGNSYGTHAFQDELVRIGKKFGLSATTGSVSDANTLKEFFSCANISSGYYLPHSKQEYVKLPDLLKTVNFIETVLEEVTKKYEPTLTKEYSYYKGVSSYKKGAVTVYGTEYEDYADINYGKQKKKDKKTKAGSLTDYFPVKVTCDGCGKYVDSYRIKSMKLSTYLCFSCMEKVGDEIEDINLLTDPYYASDA